MEQLAVMTEKMAVVYQRGRWLISNVSDVRIIWNITTTPKVSIIGDINLTAEHE
jgi:hypothetical protein